MHSESVAHEVRHSGPSQPNPLHDRVCRAGQAPAPSQVAEVVATPSLQAAARQASPAPGKEHAEREVPSQAPPHAEPSLAHASRAPWGAPATAVHVPIAPGASHASH